MEVINREYNSFFIDVKTKVQKSQQRAIQAVNYELVLLYWEIGSIILKKEAEKGWGGKVIDLLSSDLKKTFPSMKGFSIRNLKYMRQFAQTYPNVNFVQETLAQLNWYINITIMQKIKEANILESLGTKKMDACYVK